jgi:hypothetical protein
MKSGDSQKKDMRCARFSKEVHEVRKRISEWEASHGEIFWEKGGIGQREMRGPSYFSYHRTV